MRGTLVGAKEAQASLARLKGASAVVRKVHKDGGDLIVRRAQDLCPVAPEEGGLLRDSIGAEFAGRDEMQSVEVFAGGPELARRSKRGKDYAAEVHEDLSARHETGQAKFLEIPFIEIGLRIPDEVERAIDRVVAKEG